MNNQAAQTMPELLPCPFCGNYDTDQFPCEWLDWSGGNVIRCAWCHGAAPAKTWNRRAITAALSQTAGVPEGWLRACDEEMVGAHIGVADASDDYAAAKKKLHDLITWHIQVATDPAVNGGFVLVPREPTQEMWKAGKSASVEAEEVYMQDRPQSVWEKFGYRKNRVKHIYNAMLAAAPAASGGEYPGCSGDPASCPENEGHGCCKPNPARHVAIVCDWKNADPFPTFIEAEIGGKSVSLEWRDRPDGLKELIVPVTAAPQPPSAAPVSERARDE